MDRLLALFVLLSGAYAAIFDKFGNILADSAYDAPEVGWALLRNNDTRFSGIHGFTSGPNGPRYCTGTLLKTWRGKTPPPNLKPYGISSVGCFIDYTNFTAVSQVFLDMNVRDLYRPDFSNPTINITLNGTFDVPARLRPVIRMSPILPFVTFNQTDVFLYQLESTASQMIAAGYRFFPIAPALPAENAKVIALTHYDAIAQNSTVNLRIAKGLFKRRYAYTVDFTPIQVEGVAFACNYASSGAPILDQNYNMVSFGSVLDTDFNAGPILKDLRGCFNATGVWNYTLPDCLKEWKTKFYTQYNVIQPGYTPPKVSTARDKPPRTNIVIVSGVTPNYVTDTLVDYNNAASKSTLVSTQNVDNYNTVQGTGYTPKTNTPGTSSAMRVAASSLSAMLLLSIFM